MYKEEHKKARSIVAAATALAILGTATFAWNAFDQEAINKTIGLSDNAGARLHDDFDGTNKDVYVENYGDEGQDLVYARIRLDEYMEVGTGAGTGTTGLDVIRGDKAKAGVTTPEFSDVSTWDTYLFESESQGTDIRKYRDLEFGGSTIYMPTFNKNSDSLTADINGTLEGLDGDMFTDEDAYLDYTEYTQDSDPVTQDAIYDIDDNDLDEGDASVEGTNHELVEETHEVEETLNATVMSMEDWKTEENAQPGEFWVYDIDGWAYWAQPIEPQTATGLLLTGFDVIENPSGEWFYGINVVAQMATAGDWGSEEDGTGFYQGGQPSDDAFSLLDRVAGLLEVDVDLEITTGQADLQFGETATLTANITVPTGYEDQDGLIWTITERTKSSGLDQEAIDATLVNGEFTPVEAMTGNTYVVTVTSEINFNATSSIILNVYDINDTDAVSISISAEGYSEDDSISLEPPFTLQFSGKVEGFVDTSIKWSVTGGAGTSSISESGLLTVEEEGKTGDKVVLTVKVEANANAEVSKTVEITVTIPAPSLDEIIATEAGSEDTANYAGYDWYVLEKATINGREAAKIWLAGTSGSSSFGSNNTYSSSSVRTAAFTWINGEDRSDIKAVAVNPLPTTTDAGDSTSVGSPSLTTDDYVFTLSYDEANAIDVSIRECGLSYWIRTPYSTYVYIVNATGTLTNNYSVASSNRVRPALWVYLD